MLRWAEDIIESQGQDHRKAADQVRCTMTGTRHCSGHLVARIHPSSDVVPGARSSISSLWALGLPPKAASKDSAALHHHSTTFSAPDSTSSHKLWVLLDTHLLLLQLLDCFLYLYTTLSLFPHNYFHPLRASQLLQLHPFACIAYRRSSFSSSTSNHIVEMASRAVNLILRGLEVPSSFSPSSPSAAN